MMEAIQQPSCFSIGIGVTALLGAFFLTRKLFQLLTPSWSYEGKVVVITGASSGIGAALAKLLASKKAKLVLGARRAPELTAVVDECKLLGCEAVGVISDVSKKEDCKLLIDSAVQKFGRVDSLVLNAGISVVARLEDVTDMSIFHRVMDVNFFGAIYPTYFALPFLKSSKGRIAVISSVAGLTGISSRSGYSASKWALHGFFESLRNELRSDGITVTLFCPGVVNTEIGNSRLGPDGKKAKEGFALDRGMAPSKAASFIAKGIADGERLVVFDLPTAFLTAIKPFSPNLVDTLVERKATQMTVPHN